MRFFHLSDLHIGLKLYDRDLGEDQAWILHQIVGQAASERPDAIVIAGDIYDKAVPSAEAVGIFDHFVGELTEAVPDAVIMMISGNHDSAPRVNCFRSVLARQNVYMIGLPPQTEKDHIEKVVLSDEYGPVNFYLLPFVKPSMIRLVVGTDEKGSNLSYDAALHRLIGREEIDGNSRNVLVSHQFYVPAGVSADSVERMDSEVITVGNIDAVGGDVLEPFDYAALGHIHKPMKVGSDRFRYCGTPLACSVSEAGQQKGILEVELREKSSVSVRTIPLRPKRQVREVRGELEEVLREPSGDYVRIVLTDQEDLDVVDMQGRLRDAFPRLLEVRRETHYEMGHAEMPDLERESNPLELCCDFLGDPDEETKELLRDVINSVLGGENR